ncbi:hypothetical protein LXA43DRAFT_198769 [Ganoderma leucocontextum]|nr:hypothetical protein LXA43DRAFT_198769 [Ganoderma leucocontextum]
MTLPLRHLLAVALFVPFLLVPAAVLVAARYALDILNDQLNLKLGADEMEKPLPDLPAGNVAASRRRSNLALTVEARAHLHRFVLRALEEESDVRDKGMWAERVGAALNELGAAVEHGGWLAGLRRARYVRKRLHDEEEKRRVEEHTRKDKEEEERARDRTAKRRSKLKEAVTVEDEPVDDEPNVEALVTSLEQLREAALRPAVSTAKPSLKHLVLMVSGVPSSEPSEDMGFKLIRSTTLHCSFNPGEFAFPKTVSGEDVTEPVVLYGLHEWDASLLSSDDPFKVVGGTFALRGVVSLPQCDALRRVLRLAVFTYLSLLLEQALLSNSDVELHYPKVAIPNLPTFPPTVERPSSSTDVKEKLRRQESGSGLWSFLSKKTEDLLHRAAHAAPIGRRGSVDLAFDPKVSRAASLPQAPDGGFLSRKLSMLSGPVAPRAPQESDEAHAATFAAVVKRMDAWKHLLSTSPGVAFPPPPFLLSIADKETKDPGRRPLGDEKAALTSLLGWQGKESLGKGVVGVSGFVRHQGLTVMYSEHVPGASVLANLPTLSKSDSASAETQIAVRTPCWGHRRKWINYRYYGRGRHWDESLGEAIVRWCEAAGDACGHPDCHFSRGEHDMRWIHNGVRLLAAVSLPTSSDASTSDDSVRMWVGCAVCGKESPKRVMHDGTYLVSFAKFLELLVYSPAIHALSPQLCEHTTFPEKPWAPANTPIPQARFNIIRRFSHKGRVVTMTLADVRDVFEVHVPRLQILRRKAGEKKPRCVRVSVAVGCRVEWNTRVVDLNLPDRSFVSVRSEGEYLEGEYLRSDPEGGYLRSQGEYLRSQGECLHSDSEGEYLHSAGFLVHSQPGFGGDFVRLEGGEMHSGACRLSANMHKNLVRALVGAKNRIQGNKRLPHQTREARPSTTAAVCSPLFYLTRSYVLDEMWLLAARSRRFLPELGLTCSTRIGSPAARSLLDGSLVRFDVAPGPCAPRE